MIVKFTNNALIDVDGADLYVFEVGDGAEPTQIEISKDGRSWINIGRIEGGTREVDIAGKVRRGDEFYFVRLTDLGTDSKSPAGADIDAVGAIGTVQRNSNQIPNTPSEIRGGSSNSGGSSDDGSIDIGRAILDKIKNRNRDKKPKENSGENNNSNDSSSNSLILNTGYNTQSNQVYSTGSPDGNWMLLQDASNSGRLPRPAYAIAPHPAWTVAEPNSQWLSYSSNGKQNLKSGDYVYQRCFDLSDSSLNDKKASLEISGRGDDDFYLAINQMPTKNNYLLSGRTSGSEGGYNTSLVRLSLKGDKLLQNLRVGRNCINVLVYEKGINITGVNLVGNIKIKGVSESNGDGGNSSGNNSYNPPPTNNPPPQDVPYDPNNQISVKLYLIELGKGKLGCGDKLTMLSMSITKRPSMLRATLEELFRYPEIQRGYTNSTAGMTLENVTLTNGEASIYVRGSLGGACDNPRFVAQITNTAKQYPTVKTVRIFLNGSEFTGQ